MTPREGTLSLEIKQVSTAGEFGGWLAVYNHEDLGGDVIERGAFTGSLQARGDACVF
jgi:hypothetical protein